MLDFSPPQPTPAHLQPALVAGGEEQRLPVREPVPELPPEVLGVEQRHPLLGVVLQVRRGERGPPLRPRPRRGRPAERDQPQLGLDLLEEVDGEVDRLREVPGGVQDVEDRDEGLLLFLLFGGGFDGGGGGHGVLAVFEGRVAVAR